MDNLGWNNTNVADAAGVYPQTVGGWSAGAWPSQPQVERLAAHIAIAYDRAKHPVYSAGHFGTLLYELLLSAGYSVNLGAGDINWERIKDVIDDRHRSDKDDPGLRIGWARMPHCDLSDSRSPPSRMLQLVRGLLGLSEESSREYSWQDIIPALLKREIDLIAPSILEVPHRTPRITFSDPIPGIRVGINCVFATDPANPNLRQQLLGAVNESSRAMPRIQPIYQDGGLGAKMSRVLFEDLATPIRVGTTHPPEEVLAALTERPDPPNIRLFIADELTCIDIFHLRKNLLLLYDPHETPDHHKATNAFYGTPIRLGACFGLHPDEPRLLRSINDAIHTISTSSPLKDLVARDFSRCLTEAQSELFRRLRSGGNDGN